MTFSAKQLSALRALVGTRVGLARTSEDRQHWRDLLAAVDAERVAVATGSPDHGSDESADASATARDGGSLDPCVGECVFSLDLPLQIEKPRKKPRLLYQKGKAKPKPLRGAFAEKLFGCKKQAAAAVKSWANLPAGVKVPHAGGEVTADWTPFTVVLAPTLNVFKSLPTFAKANARKEIAERIAKECQRWPSAHWGGQKVVVKRGTKERLSPVGGERRFVRVTRHSTRRPDDLSPDVIGGKLVLDQVVEAGILGDDSDAWCERVGAWEPAKAGEGFLRVEVFTLKGDQALPRAAAERQRRKKEQAPLAPTTP